MNWNIFDRIDRPCPFPAACSRRSFLAQTLVVACGAGCQSLRSGNARAEEAACSSDEEEVCLSLGVLSRRVEEALKAGRTVPKEIESLCGIAWLDGYVLDPGRDIILVGRRSSWRPSLSLEDLLVNLHNVWKRLGAPYCSLDPRREDVRAVNELFQTTYAVTSLQQMREFYARLKRLWGPQIVRVGGVPSSSRHARIIVEADYQMKQLSQGHVTAPGVVSYLDRGLEQMKQTIRSGGAPSAQGLSMARLWFHVGAGEPTFSEGNGVVWLDRCSVVLLTEQQRAAADGTLHDSGGEDPNARAFAEEVTRAFLGLGRRTPVYADLENLFRLHALLRAMHFSLAFDRAGFDARFLLQGCQLRLAKPLPPSMPGLVNGKEEVVPAKSGGRQGYYVLHPMVCGGVGMDMQIDRSCFRKDIAGKTEPVRLATFQARPHAEALCWPLGRLAAERIS